MDPSDLLAELQSLLCIQCRPPISIIQEKLSEPACLVLLRAYNATQPQVHFILDHDPPPQTVPLHDYTVFYHYRLLDGCCITPASQSKCTSAGSSLVKVDFDGQLWYIVGCSLHVESLLKVHRLARELQVQKATILSYPIHSRFSSKVPDTRSDQI
jgi:hypothetical protein